MIQSSDGQIFGDVSCTKYALERLSDSIKKPILAYLKEQETDRQLRQRDSEVNTSIYSLYPSKPLTLNP